MRLLILSPYLPHRNVGHGGGISIRHMVRHLGRLHETTLVSLVRENERGLAAGLGAELGVDVRIIPFRDESARGLSRLGLFADRLGALGRSVVRSEPFYAAKYWSRRISAAVRDAVIAVEPDVIHVQCMQLTLYLRDLRRMRDAGVLEARLVLGSDELSSLPWRRRLEAAGNPVLRGMLRHQVRAWRRLQTDATRWADVTFCVTDQDRDMLLADGGRACHTVPLGVDIEAVSPVHAPDGPPRLLFVGSFSHRPNRSAAEFLVDKVWPEAAKYGQDMEMVLAGRGSRRFLAARGDVGASVTALGFVEDLTDLYRRCHLFVAPMTEGGGIKIKILEAMAHGIPVATTPTGAEGITDEDDGAIWIAEPDEAFADAVRLILDDPDAAAARAVKARAVIEERFGWPAIARRMSDLYTDPERG